MSRLKRLQIFQKSMQEAHNLNFTTRQDIQFHFIRVEDLPLIFESLNSVGLTTIFAAGDVPRNVVTCPINSVDEKRIYDVSTIVKEINDYLMQTKMSQIFLESTKLELVDVQNIALLMRYKT